MARLPSPRVLAELMRGGHLRARMRSARDGLTAVRVQAIAAAIDIGLLDAVAGGAGSTAELARRLGVADLDLLDAYLRVLAAAGLVTGDGRWQLTRFGRAVVEDDAVRASYQGFGSYHTDVYRDMAPVLRGGPRRRDTTEQGEVIARLSAAISPFIRDRVVRTVNERRPRRVLDIGCGTGQYLSAMLEAAPTATGIGLDADADAAALAERTLRDRGQAGRATVAAADLRTALATGHPAALRDGIDVALMANVIYYEPVDERVELLGSIAGLLSPGGALVIVTTFSGPQFFSRHLDLVLRAQEGRMELPAAEVLVGQLREAGLEPEPLEPMGPPSAALGSVTAVRPAVEPVGGAEHA
ncbi:MAG: methyltransferase domain-containing protein [Candidatus Nanopelagicales bacterium]